MRGRGGGVAALSLGGAMPDIVRDKRGDGGLTNVPGKTQPETHGALKSLNASQEAIGHV